MSPDAPAAGADSVTRPPAPAACSRCGHDADFDFGALWLCVDCYHIAGSTCAGLGHRAVPTAEAGTVC